MTTSPSLPVLPSDDRGEPVVVMSDAERARLGADDAISFHPLRFGAAGVIGLASLLCGVGFVGFVASVISAGSTVFAVLAAAGAFVSGVSMVGLAKMAWRYAHSLPLTITSTTTPAERRRLLEDGEPDLIVRAQKQVFMRPTTTIVPSASVATLATKPPR